MNFSNFRNWLMAEIIRELERMGLDAEVEFFDVDKYDASYPGISVRFADRLSGIVLNLEKIYAIYQENPDPAYIKNNAMRIILEQNLDNRAVSGLTDYDGIRDRLFIQVCSADKNRDALNRLPHRIIADLAVTYHILVQTTDEGMASAAVTNELLGIYGVSVEQLHKDALASAPGKLRPLFDTIKSFIFSPSLSPDKEPVPGAGIMVLSNEFRTYGASALFYPGMMDKISEYFRDDFIMIPSSVNEVIVLPAKGADMKLMKDMVTSVNSLMVSEEEMLTNNVYRYDAKEKLFESAKQYEERLLRGRDPGRDDTVSSANEEKDLPSRDEGPER